MFNKAEILARLQNGDTVDQIAKEMSEVLNEAQKAYNEEDRVCNAKREAAMGIIDAFCDYIVAAGAPQELLDELHSLNADKIVEMLDGTIKFAEDLEKLKNLEFDEKRPTATLDLSRLFGWV